MSRDYAGKSAAHWRGEANQWEQTAKVIKDQTIEECARVAESHSSVGKTIAVFIRALKDKP